MFEHETFFDLVAPLEDLYNKVIRYTYGQHVSEVHPFIVTDPNPLYILIQLNVILLGSPIVAAELVGRVRFLQIMRAIFAVVAFKCLGRALNRSNLAISSQDRQSTLVVQVALLLEQVVEMRGDVPAAPIACARGLVFEEMRYHLIQFLSSNLQKLLPASHSLRVDRVQNAANRGHLGVEFWASLSNFLPFFPLQKPPMLRKYVDLHWDECGVEEGEALHEYFSSHCSITCK
jgi:hypothetical protein